MFAALDTLITLLIFAGIALISHFIRRARGGDEFEEPSEPPGRGGSDAPAPPKRMTWEEELRKFLEERSAPPPIVREMPGPAPTVYVPQPAPPPLIQPAEPRIETQSPAARPHVEPWFQASPQSEELRAFDRASHLEENVAKHFDQLTRHRIGLTRARQPEKSREARNALAMIRNPKTVRTVIVASFILGPPQALVER